MAWRATATKLRCPSGWQLVLPYTRPLVLGYSAGPRCRATPRARASSLVLLRHHGGGAHHHHHHDDDDKHKAAVDRGSADMHKHPAHHFGGVAWKPKRHEKEEERRAMNITWLGLGSNVVLTIGKAIAGVLGNSAAMVADALHSLSDLVSDAITLVSIKYSRRLPDSRHPYGFGKYETCGAFAVSILLVGGGIGMAHHTVEMLLAAEAVPVPTQIALWGALASIASKEALFQITNGIGKKLDSKLLIANAWHHRSDAISSLVALVGIVGATMGVPILDPLASLCVCYLIIKTGWSLGWETVKELAEMEDDFPTLAKITELVETFDEIKHHQHVRKRKMGFYYCVDLQIQVDPMLSVADSSALTHRVRQRIMDEVPLVREVLIETSAFGMAPISGIGHEHDNELVADHLHNLSTSSASSSDTTRQ